MKETNAEVFAGCKFNGTSPAVKSSPPAKRMSDNPMVLAAREKALKENQNNRLKRTSDPGTGVQDPSQTSPTATR